MSSSDIEAPRAVYISALDGVTKKEAEDYCRGFIEKHLTSVSNAWFHVKRQGSGFYYEIHEGGVGRGFIDSIIEKARAIEADSGYFEIGSRKLRFSRKQSGLECMYVKEGFMPEAGEHVEKLAPSSATVKMSPYVREYKGLIMGSAITLAASVVMFAIVISSLAGVKDYSPKVLGMDLAEKITHLPSAHVPNIDADDKDYVTKMEYRVGRWHIERANGDKR